MRDLNVVLADIEAVEGLSPGLGWALDSYRDDIAYTPPERARPLWDVVFHEALVPWLGIPPRGEPERVAWAIWRGVPVDQVPAAAAAGEVEG